MKDKIKVGDKVRVLKYRDIRPVEPIGIVTSISSSGIIRVRFIDVPFNIRCSSEEVELYVEQSKYK